MAIQVVCPGCKKRFRVSDSYAGQKGPCPQCKTEITIPGVGDEIVIHAPEAEGPKDSTGRKVSAPILREQTRFSPVAAVVTGVAIVVVLGLAIAINNPPWPILALGALALGPALSLGGYTVLRNDEYEPYRGNELLVRALCCGVAYAALWGVYWWLQSPYGLDTTFGITALIYVLPPFVLVGGFAAFASLDLDYMFGLLHYGLYLLVTSVLCFLMGVPLFQQATE